MLSLSTHLRADDHDRLAFRADCPICRTTRMSGTLRDDVAAPRRATALVVGSALALGATMPAGLAVAADPSGDQSAAPSAASQPPPNDPEADPDFDPGGPTTDLPDAPPPAVAAPVDNSSPVDGPSTVEAAPAQGAPADDPADPVVDQGDGSDPTTTTAATPPPPAATVPPAPSATAPTVPTTPPPTTSTPSETEQPAPAPVAAQPVSASGPAPKVTAPSAPRSERTHARKRHVRHVTVRPAAGSAAPAPQPAVAVTSRASASVASVAIVARPAKPGDRTHRVQPGESLWAIAADLLGTSATPARIAREVHRMWTLNASRIATGNPDLLMTGTVLELR